MKSVCLAFTLLYCDSFLFQGEGLNSNENFLYKVFKLIANIIAALLLAGGISFVIKVIFFYYCNLTENQIHSRKFICFLVIYVDHDQLFVYRSVL